MSATAQARYLPGGGVELRFPFERGLVDGLKAEVPPRQHGYDPARRAWIVDARFAARAVRLLKSVFPEAAIMDPPQARQFGLVSASQAMAELHFLRSHGRGGPR